MKKQTKLTDFFKSKNNQNNKNEIFNPFHNNNKNIPNSNILLQNTIDNNNINKKLFDNESFLNNIYSKNNLSYDELKENIINQCKKSKDLQ